MLSILTISSCATTKKSTEEDKREKPVILVVSFGTSYNDSREKTIGAIENKIRAAYGNEYEVRRAFTSQFIINKLKKRDGLVIDTVDQALQRCIDDGIKTLVVQPTHVMGGKEDDEMKKTVAQFADKFETISIGTPLLTTEEDYEETVQVLTRVTSSSDDGKTAIVFMGHGTTHPANSTYATLQTFINRAGYGDRYFIGTVEATPTLQDMIDKVTATGFKKVVLQPFMIVAGDHANNDMAGDGDESWKTAFEKAGFQVTCVIKGLGEIPEIQDLFVKKTADAINHL